VRHVWWVGLGRQPLELIVDDREDLWWLRRQRPSKSNETAVAGYRHQTRLVQQLLIEKMDPNWRQSYRRVATVLSQTVRASSAVECMNSVLRMHQSRHRMLTQGMLNLKRLYWNTHVFSGGQGKGACPYEHLGLKLRTYDFWSLIQVRDACRIEPGEGRRQAQAKNPGYRSLT
jgi:hypothetical protein